jgi:hypothetical protein
MEAKWITTIPIVNSTSMSDNVFGTCAPTGPSYRWPSRCGGYSDVDVDRLPVSGLAV